MSNAQPVISVIGTIYNQADLAERTLDIWCRQNFDHPYEIIVLDDGSNDGTREMVMEMDRKYPGLIRYFYFNEPDLIRNCTLLFNSAITRLARADIMCIQWYDRIPSTFDALTKLYEPHQKAEKQFISFQHRHIAGSSSRDVIDPENLDELMQSVDWRADPMKLVSVMGEPGAHCYPEGMNESACFSFRKEDFLAINGYDERYFRVANYSNIELWGRFKEYGLEFTITDDFTFHQPHPANRADIQTQLEPDDVLIRNTRIRQEYGQILDESAVPEDQLPWSIILPKGASSPQMDDVEFLQGNNVNDLVAQARGTNILIAHTADEVVLRQCMAQSQEALAAPEIGCVGPAGGSLLENSKWIPAGKGTAEAACGDWIAFDRKAVTRNGIRMADLGEHNLSMVDFCQQMKIWGGRTSVNLAEQQVEDVAINETFAKRWDFL